MSKYILYFRVSTDKQDYEQQKNTVEQYLMSAPAGSVVEIMETISGGITYKDRKLNGVFDIAERGDTIVVSELSRIARSMSDLFNFLEQCQKKDIYIVEAKASMVLSPDPNNMVTKIYVAVVGMGAEMELRNIQQRTKSALDYRARLIETEGGYTSKSGNWITKLGNPNLADYSDLAAAGRAEARRERRLNDPEWMKCYNLANELRDTGATLSAVADTLNAVGFEKPGKGKWNKVSVKRLIETNINV